MRHDVRTAVLTATIGYLGCSAAWAQTRSGRLLEYRGPSYDSLTVYNDGAIDYRDTRQRHFNREKLSDQELSELLRGFAAVSFDAIRRTSATHTSDRCRGSR